MVGVAAPNVARKGGGQSGPKTTSQRSVTGPPVSIGGPAKPAGCNPNTHSVQNYDCEMTMPDPVTNSDSGRPSNRITVEEIARHIGRLAVYDMLEQQIIPAIRPGRRWIITRHAYEQWERTCGT